MISQCALFTPPIDAAQGGTASTPTADFTWRYRSEGTVHAAKEPEHLEFELSVLDGSGAVSFTGRYDLLLTEVDQGTRLRLDLRITDTTVEAVPYIAGIETGWGQVLDNLTGAVQRATVAVPEGKGTKS